MAPVRRRARPPDMWSSARRCRRAAILDPHRRPVVLALVLAQLLAAAPPRSGPGPRAGRGESVRLPRRALPSRGTLSGRRPRG